MYEPQGPQKDVKRLREGKKGETHIAGDGIRDRNDGAVSASAYLAGGVVCRTHYLMSMMKKALPDTA